MKATALVTEDPVPLSPRTRFRVALILAMAADALQNFGFRYLPKALCRPLMTCSTLRSQPCW